MSSSLDLFRDLGVSEGLVGSGTGGGLAGEEAGDEEEELVDCAGEGALVGSTDEAALSATSGEGVLLDRFRDLGVSEGLVGS